MSSSMPPASCCECWHERALAMHTANPAQLPHSGFPFLPSEAPFNEHSLLASPPPPAPLSPEDDASLARALEAQGGPFEPQPGSLAMSNLDDWLLFYTADDSVAILGAPTTVIPFHISQAQSR